VGHLNPSVSKALKQTLANKLITKDWKDSKHKSCHMSVPGMVPLALCDSAFLMCWCIHGCSAFDSPQLPQTQPHQIKGLHFFCAPFIGPWKCTIFTNH
jgi:hypothetical protein